MAEQTIKCPKCNAEIEIGEVLAKQIEAQVAERYEARIAEAAKTAKAAAEAELETERAKAADEIRKTADKARDDVEAARRQAKTDVETARADAARRETEIRTAARTEAETRAQAETADLSERLRKANDDLAKTQARELALRRRAEEIDQREANLALEIARKVDEERGKIRTDAAAKAAEIQKMRDGEHDELVRGLREQIENLRQRAEQGSQQLQGETQEIVLEAELRAAFPGDDVVPVPKGIRGADCVQNVATAGGIACGSILWESKRTKHFGGDWCDKLKEDAREAKADIAVIVTATMPEGVRHVGLHQGVWVCDFASFLGLAVALRAGLVQAGLARAAAVGKNEKMEAVYDYLTGTEFRQAVQGIVETILALKADLDSEKRAFERRWAGREKLIDRVSRIAVRMFGSVQAMAGTAAIPTIPTLELTEGTPPKEPGEGEERP